MKAVSLTPDVSGGAAAAASRSSVSSKTGNMLGGIAVVGLLAVGGFLGYGKVNALKTETLDLNNQATMLNAEAQRLQAQVTEAGNKTDYTSLASASQEQVTTSLGARVDYARLTRELAYAVPKGVKLDDFSSATGSDGDGFTANGTAPDLETINRFISRLNSLPALEDVHIGKAERDGSGYAFGLTGELLSGADMGGATGDGATGGDGAQTIGNGTGGAAELALVPEPGYGEGTSSAPKKKKKPASAMEKLVSDSGKLAKSGGSSS